MTQPLGNCPGCAGDEPFEQVHRGLHADERCPDVDGECPEWVCTGCGAGVFMGAEVVTDIAAVADIPSPIRLVQSARAA
jgi:hypothetical protein